MADLNGVRAGVLLASARDRLAGMPQGRRDAEWLLRAATGLTSTQILTHPEFCVENSRAKAFLSWVERRSLSEPMQYILGTQEFFGLAFEVSPAVLIPRPETEHLVEAAIAIASDVASGQMADVGTGSGAIAVAFASRMREWSVLATDNSPAALAVAKRNAENNGVLDCVRFVSCDLLPAEADGLAMICSNPPYVPSGEVLETQVTGYEPHSALFAGEDGLDVYRRLIPRSARALQPGGWILLEIGQGQADRVESLLTASDFREVRFLPDLQGILRVAVARQQ